MLKRGPAPLTPRRHLHGLLGAAGEQELLPAVAVVSGLVRPIARAAGRQDRGIEGGGAEHQLPRRRAAQLQREQQ